MHIRVCSTSFVVVTFHELPVVGSFAVGSYRYRAGKSNIVHNTMREILTVGGISATLSCFVFA